MEPQTEIKKSDIMIQLNGELDSFRDLLSFSQKWLSRIDGMSPAVMQEMLNFREKWITRVSNRKEDWISLARQAGEEYAGKFIKSMSGALTELQTIDAQIYKRLEERKQDYLRLISDLTSSGNSKTGSWKNHEHSGQRVDILRK